MILLDEARAALLYVYHLRLTQLHDAGYATIEDVASPFDSKFLPWGLFGKAAEESERNRYLVTSRYADVGEDASYQITAAGIRYIERNHESVENAFRRVFQAVPRTHSDVPENAWREPDSSAQVGEQTLDEIKRLLAQCVDLIERQNLSQQDRADAEQRIKAAQEAVKAPNPPWKGIYELIKPFTNSFMGKFAKCVVHLIFGAN